MPQGTPCCDPLASEDLPLETVACGPSTLDVHGGMVVREPRHGTLTVCGLYVNHQRGKRTPLQRLVSTPTGQEETETKVRVEVVKSEGSIDAGDGDEGKVDSTSTDATEAPSPTLYEV